MKANKIDISTKKTVLFDMDGTLFQSEPLHADALRKTLLEIGIDIPLKQLEEKFTGIADTIVFKELTDSDDIDSLIKKKNTHLKNTIASLTPDEAQSLYTTGIKELLVELKQNNTNLAVVSASETEIVDLMVEHSGLKDYFSLTMGRNDTEFTKPHPDPYLRAMQFFGSTPEETIIFEDSDTGLAAAKATDAQYIKISNELNPSDNGELTTIANFLGLIK